MDTLWSNYALLNRNVMLCIIDSTYGIEESVILLTKNQEAIGKVFIPFYSERGANVLTILLTNHINCTLNLFHFSKTKNTPAYTNALAAWYSSGESIAAFFYANNLGQWSQAVWSGVVKQHLNLSNEALIAQENDEKAKALDAYDKSRVELMILSEMMTKGLLSQCPEQF